MKKIQKSSELLWLLGVIFVAFGVAICSKSNLGVSMIAAPAFIIQEAVSPYLSFASIGMVEYAFQGFLLLVMCILVKKINWRYFLSFAVAVIYGYALDLFLLLCNGLTCTGLASQMLALLAGDIITAVGVACFFRTYLPLQVYELFVAELSAVKKIDISKVKNIFDKSLFVISIVLILVLFRDFATTDFSNILQHDYHSMGIGTIITVIINAPIIKLAGKVIDKLFDNRARFEGLEAKLKREH